jgi:hypothetical protein
MTKGKAPREKTMIVVVKEKSKAGEKRERGRTTARPSTSRTPSHRILSFSATGRGIFRVNRRAICHSILCIYLPDRDPPVINAVTITAESARRAPWVSCRVLIHEFPARCRPA